MWHPHTSQVHGNFVLVPIFTPRPNGHIPVHCCAYQAPTIQRILNPHHALFIIFVKVACRATPLLQILSRYCKLFTVRQSCQVCRGLGLQDVRGVFLISTYPAFRDRHIKINLTSCEGPTSYVEIVSARSVSDHIVINAAAGDNNNMFVIETTLA